jgi:O-antigen ligase/tetratricopeptide (TPR) repeat protein
MVKKTSFVLFISPLLFAPLAFGTVEHWSLLTVQLLVAAGVLIFCLQHHQSGGKLLHVPGLFPLFLLLGWILLQLLPLPVALVKLFSPATVAVYQPVYDMLESGSWMVLSVYPKGTLLEFLRITTYIFFYILTVQLLSDGALLKRTVVICSWLAIGIGFLAILQKFSSPEHIYWFRPAPTGSAPMGPWVYRSQYCGYIELVAPLVLALTLYYWPHSASGESLRKRVVALFSKDEGSNPAILLAFGLLVVAASLFISLSRGGIIAFSLSLVFFFCLLAWKEARYSSLFFIGIVVAVILSVSWFGWEPIVARFDEIVNRSGQIENGRFLVWEDSWQIIKDFWLTGSGFGSFIAIFPLYRTFPGEEIYDHAHNDYIELLTDGGIVGFLLVAWFVVEVVRHGWKMLRRRRDRYAILLSIAALTGIFALLIHSFSDFNMHNGAVGLYFFFICGLLVSAGHTRYHYQMNVSLLPKSRWLTQHSLLFAGGVFFCLVVVAQGGVMLAQYRYNGVKDIYLSRQLSKQRLEEVEIALQAASRFDPLEGLYLYYQGEVQRYLHNPQKALELYVQASLKEPLDGAFLQNIGLLLPPERQKEAAYLLEEGAKRTLKREQLMLTRVEWLLTTGQREVATKVLRGAIAEKANLVKVVVPLLQSFSFTREEVAGVLPEDVESWMQCGDFFEKMGYHEEAAYFWQRGLQFIHQKSVVQPHWFSTLYNYYKKQQDNEKALEILRLAIDELPGNSRFHEWLGDYYAGEGIVYRAQEEYQQVLLLEPQNEAVRRKLESLGKAQ